MKAPLIMFLIFSVFLSQLFSQDQIQEDIENLLQTKSNGAEYIDYSKLIYRLRNDSVKQNTSVSFLINQFEHNSPPTDGFILELIYQIAQNSEFSDVRQKGVNFMLREYYHPLSNHRDVNSFYKNDFTKESKEIVLNYLNQNFDTTKFIGQWCRYNSYLNLSRNKHNKTDNNTLDSICDQNFKKYSRNTISFLKITPEIILLSGWLDINNSVSYLSKIAETSESNELIISSKLALARLGKECYKDELLKKLESTPWNANNKIDFKRKTKWLHYINSREIINLFLQGLESEIPSQCMDYDPPVPTNYKVLVYLPNVFVNFLFSKEYLGILICDPSMINKDDIQKAKTWINENYNNIELDRENFIYPVLN